MKIITNTLIKLCIAFAIIGALSACGQKGPLEVERTIPIQEEESEPTK